MSKKNLRDQLRSLTVGKAKQFQKKLVTIDGAEFEIRQPSVAQRSALLRAAGMVSTDKDKKDGDMDFGLLQVLAVIKLTYVPGTNEHVFEAADKQSLLDQPANSFVDALSEVAMKLLNVEPEQAAKN